MEQLGLIPQRAKKSALRRAVVKLAPSATHVGSAQHGRSVSPEGTIDPVRNALRMHHVRLVSLARSVRSVPHVRNASHAETNVSAPREAKISLSVRNASHAPSVTKGVKKPVLCAKKHVASDPRNASHVRHASHEASGKPVLSVPRLGWRHAPNTPRNSPALSVSPAPSARHDVKSPVLRRSA